MSRNARYIEVHTCDVGLHEPPDPLRDGWNEPRNMGLKCRRMGQTGAIFQPSPLWMSLMSPSTRSALLLLFWNTPRSRPRQKRTTARSILIIYSSRHRPMRPCSCLPPPLPGPSSFPTLTPSPPGQQPACRSWPASRGLRTAASSSAAGAAAALRLLSLRQPPAGTGQEGGRENIASKERGYYT